MIVTGTFFNGSIVLDQPLDATNGELLTLELGEDDRCADGQAEVETWRRRIEELPALFDDEADTREFENRMQEMRLEQASTLAARGERVAQLFRS